MVTWAERIPQAIEKGETHFGSSLDTLWAAKDSRFVITPGEVALAKVLWAFWLDEYEGTQGLLGEPPDALRAFTEKVEAL